MPRVRWRPMAVGAVRIVYVGHSTVLVEMEGVRLLTDPLLRSRLLHLRRTDDVARPLLDELDAVLVSHLHFDHLDLPSLRPTRPETCAWWPREVRATCSQEGLQLGDRARRR